MSLCVCGIIHAGIRDVEFEVELAFRFEKKANELGIGTKMGGNISRYVYDKYSNEHGKVSIIFELIDSPLDNQAEDLFGEDIFEEDGYVKNPSLQKRMDRVQKLFEYLLDYPRVTQIDLEINYLFEEGEEYKYIRVSEFCDKVAEIYNKSAFLIPVTKFKIVRY